MPRPIPFDLSDVDVAIQTERDRLRLLEQRSRAFAQGFTAALEGGEASREWLEHYKERSG